MGIYIIASIGCLAALYCAAALFRLAPLVQSAVRGDEHAGAGDALPPSAASPEESDIMRRQAEEERRFTEAVANILSYSCEATERRDG